MHISTQTLLASQQTIPPQPRPAPDFSAALEKTEGFAPLPLKQAAPMPDFAKPAQVLSPGGSARLGSLIDIKI